MDRIKISKVFSHRLERLGITPHLLLQQARLPLSLLEQEQISLTTAQWFALWQALEELSDDPAIGLRIGSDEQMERFNPLMITAVSARTFHEALNKMARYKRLFCSEEMRISEHADGWVIEAAWLASHEAPPTLLIDSMFASFVKLGQVGTGKPLYPLQLMLARPASEVQPFFEAYFRCPVELGAAKNMLVYSHEALAQPFQTYNPELLELLEPQLDRELYVTSKTRITEQVKALLRRILAGHQPTLQDIAQRLDLSTRTLQRRLTAEKSRFQQLLEEVRHELSLHYLNESSLDLSEIAYLLGYEDAGSFHRAFHQWQGQPPGQWRASQRQNHLSAA